MEAQILHVDDEQITILLHPDRDTELEVFLRRTSEFQDGTMTKKYALTIFERGDTGKIAVVTVPE